MQNRKKIFYENGDFIALYCDYFGRSQQEFIEKEYSLETPLFAPHVRIIKKRDVLDENGNSYVIKLMYAGRDSFDKSPEMVRNDLVTQEILKEHLLPHREYLIFDPDGNNSLGIPCAISVYIHAHTLEEDRRSICNTVERAFSILFKVHSLQTKDTFGGTYPLLEPVEDFAEFSSRYLIRDMRRDRISLPKYEVGILEEMIAELNKIKNFCLCHCDATGRNILHNANEVTLIDWSYATFHHPCIDLAYLLYPLFDNNEYKYALSLMKDWEYIYKELGYDIFTYLSFFLVFRLIEVSRVKGKEAKLAIASNILQSIHNKSFSQIIEFFV